MVRVKPSKPPSGSRISLHALDKSLTVLIPLNLFYKPSSSGPKQLGDFVNSLQGVLDCLPMIAGSIYNVEDVDGLKSKELVDDGRGVDLIWVDCPISYVDFPDSDSLSPRSPVGDIATSGETLLIVKFTKFSCGTLAMCISLSHMFADCASYVDVIKEWARASRGDSKSDHLCITSWERDPGKFFPLPSLSAIPPVMGPPDVTTTSSSPVPRPGVMTNFLITFESLRRLKDECKPVDPNVWVSTGDCVAALLWRAITSTREVFLQPDRDVHVWMAADGRSRSKVQPDASKYFGNLLTPITVTLSKPALLEGSLASVASSFRRTMNQELTETKYANILASFEAPLQSDYITRMTNWTKFPLAGDALNFGGGAPALATCTTKLPPGRVGIVPHREGYLCGLSVETDLAGKLYTRDELLMYAQPVDQDIIL